jgi:ribosomal protein S6--L-glutamate ligase
MIVTRFSQLTQVYAGLGPGDVFIGQVPQSCLKTAILVDLTQRGVRLLPSATAQTLSVSKCAQAYLLRPWMVPHTRVITRRKQLLDAVGEYRRQGIATAVTKQEHQHCGHGVRKWSDLEMLYNCMSLDDRHYPFILQPFYAVAADVRIIVVGEYWEAYARCNSEGFRKNLAAGGSSRPHTIEEVQRVFCTEIMARGQMPYAHIDLMVTAEGSFYLSEMNLNSGVHGARISRVALDRLKQSHLERLAAEASGPSPAV